MVTAGNIWWKTAYLVFLGLCLSSVPGWSADEVMPPAPKQYFNDYAGVVATDAAQRLNRTLEQFEKDTSSQIVVAVFPKLLTDSSMEDYTERVFQAWKPGQKGKDNGVVLFVFVQDRKMRIEVGYGLEGAIPDAIAKRIIEDEIGPRFKQGDYTTGLTAGVTALTQAAKGEYKGTGRTVAEGRRGGGKHMPWPFFLFIAFMILAGSRRRRGMVYDGGGHHSWGGWNIGGGGWSGGGGGGWSSGGGFSGGGGSSGGGGASGSW